MKRMLLAALAVLCIGATVAGAANYRVEFSGDNTLSSCALASNGVGPTSVHVFLVGDGGVTAVLFGASIPSCWSGATWIGDQVANPNWLRIGSTQQDLGLSIAFGECLSLPLYLGTVNFFGTTEAPCCAFPVTHPAVWENFSTPAQVADCNFYEVDAAGGSVIVTAGPACPCQQALATEQSTWGRVKSLYR